MEAIRDYGDEQKVFEIAFLLKECNDLFPYKFIEIKGIQGDLGEIKISLNLDVKPIKNQPYKLNPQVT